MSSGSYLARFRSATAEFFTGTLAWPAPSGPLLPPPWWQSLRSRIGVDLALRLTGGEKPSVLLLLTAEHAQPLEELLVSLTGADKPAGIKEPTNSAEFDELAAAPLAEKHLRVHHGGYHWENHPLGCDFRFYPTWSGQGLPEGVSYQAGLRFHRPDAEQERRVRKYLAWLDLEEPFTPSVHAVQNLLCRRLLSAGWLTDEYLLFADATLQKRWEDDLRAHFSETTGRIGFREAPIEAGDFSDWLMTGCHTARDSGIPAALPVQAASTFSEEEVSWLVAQSIAWRARAAPGAGPDIFISYASTDFRHAEAVRQHLESIGWRCWIAPRDINVTGLSYTEAIPRALQEVRAVVVLLSPSANLSVHIPRELDLALERKLPLLPLRLVELQPAGQLAYLLRTCQWLDLFGREQNEAMSELAKRLRGLGL